MVATNHGAPVLIGDVAAVSVGHQPRLGIAGKDDDDDIVQGIVLMRRGEESMPTIKRVEAEVEKINGPASCRPACSIEKIYDRSELINLTTHTVLHNMIVGIILIFLLQWVFLGNLRSAVIVGDDHPVRAVVRHRPHGAARRVGEPALGGRHRFRPDRRRHRHHGREHLPPPGQADATVRPWTQHCTACRVRSGFRGKFAVISSPRPRSTGRSSSRRRSSSRASCRCSRCRASRAISSGRWRRPMPMRSPAA